MVQPHFLPLGTCAVPKPRRRALRRPRPAPEGKPSWTPIPLALAYTLRAAFPLGGKENGPPECPQFGFQWGGDFRPTPPPARGRTLWTPMPLTLRALPNHAACLRPALVDSALPKFASHPTISTSCTRQPVSRCSTSCRSALGQHALSCPTALQTIQQQKSQPSR